MEQLKSVTCTADCGFSVRSHNEKEIVNIVQSHAKNQHGKDMNERDIKNMIKTEPAPMMSNR